MWCRNKKGFKMYDRDKILSEYKKQGYNYLGCVMYNQKAFDAYRESNKHEAFKVGRCLELIVMHDLKAIVEYDFGD